MRIKLLGAEPQCPAVTQPWPWISPSLQRPYYRASNQNILAGIYELWQPRVNPPQDPIRAFAQCLDLNGVGLQYHR